MTVAAEGRETLPPQGKGRKLGEAVSMLVDDPSGR